MGLISGALGGLGQAIQQNAQLGMQNDAAMERDARQNVATEQRDIRQTKLREELEAKRAETIEANRIKSDERNAGIYNKAVDAAPAAGDERRFQKFKTDIGQTDATEDQLRTVFKNQYNERTVGNFRGADRYTDPASANNQDIVGELRKNAAPATMVMSAQKDYQTQLASERQATLDALTSRRQTETERHNAAREDGQEARTAAILSAAEIRASKTASRTDKQEALLNLNTTLSASEKIAKDGKEELFRMRKGTPEYAAIKAKVDSAERNISLVQRALNNKLENYGNDSSKPSKDKSANVDTTSALADAKRAIAKNPSNRAEVIRRLEAAGISTKGL